MYFGTVPAALHLLDVRREAPHVLVGEAPEPVLDLGRAQALGGERASHAGLGRAHR